MKKPHKHAELIKAWADGAEIECRLPFEIGYEKWYASTEPKWLSECEYRIKPKKNPDVVKFYRSIDCELLYTHFPSEASISITWDGESKTIKSLDLIKC